MIDNKAHFLKPLLSFLSDSYCTYDKIEAEEIYTKFKKKLLIHILDTN
jgi:hypothetical protein